MQLPLFYLLLCISLSLADQPVSNVSTSGGYKNVAYFVNWSEKCHDQRDAGGLIVCQGDLQTQFSSAEFDRASTYPCPLRIRKHTAEY